MAPLQESGGRRGGMKMRRGGREGWGPGVTVLDPRREGHELAGG